MGNLVIAIGRQHGSGGRYIGEQLAERLGIKCYNSELITETAVKGGFAQQYIAENEERRPQSLLFSLVMGYGSPESQPVALRLFTEQSKVIKEIAERESCVMIGRCADYVLRYHPGLVRVFVHAPLDVRVKRLCETDGLSAEEAEKSIKKTDKQRAGYHSFYANQDWGLAENYDLCINTGKTGITGAVDLIEAYTKLRPVQ